MQEQLQITFKNMRTSQSMERRIREESARLVRYYPRILGMRVVVSHAEHRRAAGNRFRVRVDLALPGGDLTVANDPVLYSSLRDTGAGRVTKSAETTPAHKHLAVAIDDAFETARRRLQDFARRQRGDTKSHRTRTKAAAAEETSLE